MAATPHALNNPGAASPRLRSWPHAVLSVGLAAAAIAAAISPVPELALAVAAIGCLVAARNAYLSNRLVLTSLAGVILLVPIRRYELPLDLPYKLEPYRILLIAVAVTLALALSVDPGIRVRRLGFGGWLAVFIVTSVLSLAPNIHALRTSNADTKVIGDAAALLTAGLMFVVVRLLLRKRVDVHGLIGTLVVAGGFVGLAAVIERRSGWNAIRVLDHVFPQGSTSRDLEQVGGAVKFGRSRAFGSAQHPIALGAELALVLPLAVYMVRYSRWPSSQLARTYFWGGCGLLMLGGIAASVSRTAVVALAATLLFAFWLRPVVVQRLLPVAVTAAIVLALVGGGAVSDLIETFQPSGGLIAEQTQHKSARSSGRLDDIYRVADIVEHSPFFGVGMSTRAAGSDNSSRLILDNAYLSRLVDTGAIGFLALLGLLLVPLRRMVRLARAHLPDHAVSDLGATLACCLVSFAVAALFYDAFAFYQVVLTLMILLAICGWIVTDVVRSPSPEGSVSQPVPASR